MIFTLFDTETTGLPKPGVAPLDKQPYIVEIGAIKFDSERMEIVDECSVLIKPPIPMPPDVIKIHGITDAMLELADSRSFKWSWYGGIEGRGSQFEPVAPMFYADEVDYLVAHNAPFDVSLLEFEFARMGGIDHMLPPAICTVQEFTHVFGRRPKLTELYKHYTGRDYAHKHRAIDDTRALLEALIAAKFFDTFKPPEPIMPLDDMLRTYETYELKPETVVRPTRFLADENGVLIEPLVPNPDFKE